MNYEVIEKILTYKRELEEEDTRNYRNSLIYRKLHCLRQLRKAHFEYKAEPQYSIRKMNEMVIFSQEIFFTDVSFIKYYFNLPFYKQTKLKLSEDQRFHYQAMLDEVPNYTIQINYSYKYK